MMTMIPILQTSLGCLYQGDCVQMMQNIAAQSVDLAFADPPFNLGKAYSSKIDDAKADQVYLEWCRTWLDEMTRVLKPGGSLFLWNLPKWNLQLGAYLGVNLTFRNWITVDIKYSLPISNRLYPSHYALLYFVKGTKPAIFHPDRLPVPCCRHCGGEQRDYGGYKDKMNPRGVNLSDVWTDIPPVRHAKYKKRDANGLPLKLMDRIVAMATDFGSVVLDPFGGRHNLCGGRTHRAPLDWLRTRLFSDPPSFRTHQSRRRALSRDPFQQECPLQASPYPTPRKDRQTPLTRLSN